MACDPAPRFDQVYNPVLRKLAKKMQPFLDIWKLFDSQNFQEHDHLSWRYDICIPSIWNTILWLSGVG